MAAMVEVDKGQIATAALVERAPPPLPDGAVRLKVESFAVTANNVTYAAIGDMFGYWNFFPTPNEGMGIVPMWGHAVVEASNCPDIAVGERVYGYLPMGSHLDVMPGNIGAGHFTDMTDYRQPMAAVYNSYARLNADPEHDPAREDARMIFGPLFKTGFLIEAMFRREDWFGADSMVMTSASSKTSLALAHTAKEKSPHIRRIGLTSLGNVAFVKSCGLYDDVVAYGDVAALPSIPTVSVDFAGNAKVLGDIHGAFGDQLKYSCLVGATHIEARGTGGASALPGPAPALFFAPDHIAATIKELGGKGFAQSVAASWLSFVAVTDAFVTVEHGAGLDAAIDAFVSTVKGTADPAIGLVVHP